MYRKHKEELTVETDVPDNDSDLESLSENEFDHVDGLWYPWPVIFHISRNFRKLFVTVEGDIDVEQL